VFLDAGGVIVLPNSGLVAATLARAGVQIRARDVAPAHYRAVRSLDRAPRADGYIPAVCKALGVPVERTADAIDAISFLADRSRSGEILWSEPAPGALSTIRALRRVGVKVIVVTNSDGHAAENLRDAQICRVDQPASQPDHRFAGVLVDGLIDSALVDVAKPDPRIFKFALACADVPPQATVHVGDSIREDVAGARASRIEPIHLAPERLCRDGGHRHVRSLRGLRQHITAIEA